MGGEGGEGRLSRESKGNPFITPQKYQSICQEAREWLLCQGLRCHQLVPLSPASHPGDIKKTSPDSYKEARVVACSLLACKAVGLVTLSLAQHLLTSQQMVQKM